MSNQIQSNEVIESLRNGIPPQKGVSLYSVGNEKLLEGVKKRHLKSIGTRGIIRFISGSWGAGKTHFFRQLREIAFNENLLVSSVELDNSTAALNKFERVFYSIISNVETPTTFEKNLDPGVIPFAAVLEESLAFLSVNQRELPQHLSRDQFAAAREKLMASRGIDIDFKKVVEKYWETYLPSELSLASEGQIMADAAIRREELLQWFNGEGTAGTYRKSYGVAKMVTKDNSKVMLQSLSEFVRLTGYAGMLILFDEAEQAYSAMRKTALKAAHNNLLSLINNIESLPGLFLLYATTPDFYSDPKHGIVIYGALASRIGKPDSSNPKALQKVWNLDASPPELGEYMEAARKIRTLYLEAYPEDKELIPDKHLIDEFVKNLRSLHPDFAALRFWRVLITSLIQHLDDCIEGDEARSIDEIYDNVIDQLRDS